MKRYTTQGIVLARIDYGEADRIITFLTPDHGKVKAIAKGVRKSRSRLAGGIEIFSVSDLTLIVGRGEINTLISSRLAMHYGNIVKDLSRTQAGYEAIRYTHRATEEGPEPAYFDLLKNAYEALNDTALNPQLISLWFIMQLLKLAGHAPNLHTDSRGLKLKDALTYNFHMDRMQFTPEKMQEGVFTVNHIKFLRVGFAARKPQILHRVQDAQQFISLTEPILDTMLRTFVRI